MILSHFPLYPKAGSIPQEKCIQHLTLIRLFTHALYAGLEGMNPAKCIILLEMIRVSITALHIY